MTPSLQRYIAFGALLALYGTGKSPWVNIQDTQFYDLINMLIAALMGHHFTAVDPSPVVEAPAAPSKS
jgi:hypothetical protein